VLHLPSSGKAFFSILNLQTGLRLKCWSTLFFLEEKQKINSAKSVDSHRHVKAM